MTVSPSTSSVLTSASCLACSSGRATSISRPTIRAASDCGVAGPASTVVDRPAAAEHGHAIGDRLHLVELVRDEDDGLAFVRHRAQRPEERLGLLRREHGGRLVHDQHARVAIERLQDLDPLLLADRELPDLRLRVHGEAVLLAQLVDTTLGGRGAQDDAAALAPVVAEHDVLRDRERLDQPEVLVHHADPRVERVARRVEADPLAVQLDLAFVLADRGPVRMFESVVLPAPFSPRSACTSPAAASKLTSSFATHSRKPLRDSGHADGRRRRGAGRRRRLSHSDVRGGALPHPASPEARPWRPSRSHPWRATASSRDPEGP